jgi:hypothetical protein
VLSESSSTIVEGTLRRLGLGLAADVLEAVLGAIFVLDESSYIVKK